jgi:hypothetical protein
MTLNSGLRWLQATLGRFLWNGRNSVPGCPRGHPQATLKLSSLLIAKRLRAYYSTNPFVVWRGEGKRKSCARVRLNKASEKHVRAPITKAEGVGKI